MRQCNVTGGTTDSGRARATSRARRGPVSTVEENLAWTATAKVRGNSLRRHPCISLTAHANLHTHGTSVSARSRRAGTAPSRRVEQRLRSSDRPLPISTEREPLTVRPHPTGCAWSFRARTGLDPSLAVRVEGKSDLSLEGQFPELFVATRENSCQGRTGTQTRTRALVASCEAIEGEPSETVVKLLISRFIFTSQRAQCFASYP